MKVTHVTLRVSDRGDGGIHLEGNGLHVHVWPDNRGEGQPVQVEKLRALLAAEEQRGEALP